MKFGSAFSDNVKLEWKRERWTTRGEPGWWTGSGRLLLFTTILLVALFLLLWRLFDLTVMRGYEYRSLADGNRTRTVIRRAPRGILFDRTGKPLVENSEVTKEDDRFPDLRYQRRYFYPGATAHVIGYVNEITRAELGSEYYQMRGYRQGDVVGRMGAEDVFEEVLRGRDGREMVEVDANGNVLRTLGRAPEVAGESVTLSLDASLSQVVEKTVPDGTRGAVIVSKPDTGEIIALYSSPSFSPQQFARGMSQDEYGALMSSPDQPLFNRAIGGVYPPGSTFKIVTALAGLEEGVVNKSTIVEDTGVITVGSFSFPNWYFKQYGKTDGTVDVVKGIERSNDIFFYKAGEWLGITKISEWAKKVGVGKTLGIELSGEATGLMPDPTWKNKTFQTPQDIEEKNNEWYLGDTYHVAIGQGYLLTTPLQVNAWTNSIASSGKLCRPTIKKVETGKLKMETCKDLKIKKETIDLVTQGMKKACEEGGTGWPLFGFTVKNIPISVACKTGTAEYGDPGNRTHAWFTAFAPVENPEISVTVILEGAGEGSEKAAPVAKKILEEWFGR